MISNFKLEYSFIKLLVNSFELFNSSLLNILSIDNISTIFLIFVLIFQ